MVGICSKPATLRGEKRKMADSVDEIVKIDASSSTRLYRQRKDNPSPTAMPGVVWSVEMHDVLNIALVVRREPPYYHALSGGLH
ncbi:hypothetical protein D6C79_05053 [Aureobasidium pullulans]|nr:hypothetical protein D6C79_05053 [Aureobasidium pullulans]